MVEFIAIERSTLKVRLGILIFVVSLLLLLGTFFYHSVEGWSYLDAFYFSAISLSTRGYGELHPTTFISVLFTVLYLFLGVAFILYMLSSFISYFLQYQEPRVKKTMDSWLKSIAPPKKDKWVVVRAPSRNLDNAPVQLPTGVRRR